MGDSFYIFIWMEKVANNMLDLNVGIASGMITKALAQLSEGNYLPSKTSFLAWRDNVRLINPLQERIVCYAEKNDDLWANLEKSFFSDFSGKNPGETPAVDDYTPQSTLKRQILNLLFVIDVSGSMRGTRIAQVNYALEKSSRRCAPARI